MRIAAGLICALLLVSPALADPTGAATPPGNAGTQSDLAGCIYESSPAAATTGQQRGLHCDANGNLLSSAALSPGGTVTTLPTDATSTDASGTVTLGGTYQTVFASSGTRKGCLIQNPPTATEVLSVKVGTMASPFAVPIGGTFSCSAGSGVVVSDTITLTAATTDHAFSAVSQ